jgi:hypothetical protein
MSPPTMGDPIRACMHHPSIGMHGSAPHMTIHAHPPRAKVKGKPNQSLSLILYYVVLRSEAKGLITFPVLTKKSYLSLAFSNLPAICRS